MRNQTRVFVTIKRDVLDPAGSAIKKSLLEHGLSDVADVRVGKIIDITFKHSGDHQKYLPLLNEISKNLLSNPIVEDFAMSVSDE